MTANNFVNLLSLGNCKKLRGKSNMADEGNASNQVVGEFIEVKC